MKLKKKKQRITNKQAKTLQFVVYLMIITKN